MDFRLLGTLEVDAGDGPLPLGGTKQRAVLAHLVLRPGAVVSSERIIDAVWDDEPPAAARNVVQTYVSRLRKVLGADRLTQRAGGYVLHAAEEEIDARRFAVLVERARAADPEEASRFYREAEILWRGPALADLQDQPALQAEIAGLEALRLAALEERMVADLAVGRHTEVVPELEALTERYPVREALWEHLMTALYRAGRQADALAAYRRARSMLVGELGLEPGAAPSPARAADPAAGPGAGRAVGPRPPADRTAGHGDAGVVHRAVQLRIGREVAVKVVGAEVANDATFIRQLRGRHPAHHPARTPARRAAVRLLARTGCGVLRDAALARRQPARRRSADRRARPRGRRAAGRRARRCAPSGRGARQHHGRPTSCSTRTATPICRTSRSCHPRAPARARTWLPWVARSWRCWMTAPADLVALLGRAAAGDLPDAAGLLSAMAAPPVSAPARNPYKGLRPFLEPDAPDFYGRRAPGRNPGAEARARASAGVGRAVGQRQVLGRARGPGPGSSRGRVVRR